MDYEKRFMLLNFRMRDRVVDDDNYQDYKKDFTEILDMNIFGVSDLEQLISVIKCNPDIPDYMKADLVVTVRGYLHNKSENKS